MQIQIKYFLKKINDVASAKGFLVKKILVIGAGGQIGSDLVPELRDKYGNNNVVAAGFQNDLPPELKESGPYIYLDVRNKKEIKDSINKFNIDIIFNLASILSALAEKEYLLSYEVNFTGLLNILEASISNNVKQVMLVSSIAAFGSYTPSDSTPNDTIQNPSTIYGISKVFTELLGNYFSEKKGLDVRGLRLPGVISWKREPTAGTTDYAVDIFYNAILKKEYTCFLNENTKLPMIYMPDAINALIKLLNADKSSLKHKVDFNISSMSFTPNELADLIKQRVPEFNIYYEIDPLKQSIADSWPNSLDDTVAREEWNWKPKYDINEMIDDMLYNLNIKLKKNM